MPKAFEILDLSAAAPGGGPLPSAPVLADYERILHERRDARGWDTEEIRRRLRHPAWPAVARLLRGESEGLLLRTCGAGPDAETQAALELIEPRPGAALAPLRLGLDANGVVEYAVLEEPPAAPPALAQAMATAAAAIAFGWDQPVRLVLVEFGVGATGGSAAFAAALAALRVRGDAHAAHLYSPFFYAHGVLQARALLAAILASEATSRHAPGPPLIAISGLRGHWAAALDGAGVRVTGVLLAGAEKPVAWLDAQVPEARATLTVQALRRLTNGYWAPA